MNMWKYIIDGILIAIIVIFALIGVAKGFFDGLLGLLGTGISLIGSVFLAKYVANFFNKIFNFEGSLLAEINKAKPEGSVSFFGGAFSFSNEKVAKFAVWLITVIILFLVFKLAIFILAKIFENVTKSSPTISGMNRLFGMVFGILQGGAVVVVLLALTCLASQIPVIGTTITDKIGETTITKWSYNYVEDFCEKNLTQEKVNDIVSRIASQTNSEDSTETPEETPTENPESTPENTPDEIGGGE